MSNQITRETLPLADNHQIRYSLYRGEGDRDGRLPLIVGLHPGWDGQTPAPYYGEGFLSSIFIPAFAESGAIIVAPDCPSGAWNNSQSKAAILDLVDHLLERDLVDPASVSLVGYSAGGWGAWYLLLDSAERFSSTVVFATLPVIDPVERLWDNLPKCEELISSRLEEWIGLLPQTPIHMVHSRADQLFDYSDAGLVFQALKDDQRRVGFTSVSDVGHFDGGGYVEALRGTVPWLLETWTTKRPN
jgi:pimeloyl-ACP methyl ester carboxylesterase